MTPKPEKQCTGCGATVTLGSDEFYRDSIGSLFCPKIKPKMRHYIVELPPVAIKPEVAERTPGPWAVNPDCSEDILAPSGEILVSVYPIYQEVQTGGTQEANSEFIVRACNSHDVMLAALIAIKDFAHGGAVSPSACAGEFGQIRDIASAAIAKAEAVQA